MDDLSSKAESPSSLASLAVVQEAFHRGDVNLAHNICVQLTAGDPSNLQARLWLAQIADFLEEKIAAYSQVLALDPASEVARRGLYEAMQMLLRQDAFLRYQDETKDIYQVRTPTNFLIAHPLPAS